MKIFTRTSSSLMSLFLVILSCSATLAQTITPSASSVISGSTVSFTTSTGSLGWGNNDDRTFTYTVTGPAPVIPASPAVFTCTNGCNTQSHNIQFVEPGFYTVTVFVEKTQGGSASSTSLPVNINVYNANIWAATNNGTRISAFSLNAGTYLAGPQTIFTPNTGTGSSTAAIAVSQPQPGINPGDPFIPYFYWLPNTSNNNGVVEVYGATINGSNQTLIGTMDLNGPSNSSLGFVRLGMGPDGVCYLLAGDGSSTVVLASFKPNGVTLNSNLPASDQIQVIDANVTVAGTGVSVSDFQNGDLAVLSDPQNGGIKIYALANVTGGTTKIFIGKPNGSSTVMTKQWDLVQPDGSPFTVSVNGVAFDMFGSMYVSSNGGVYYVNAATINTSGPGTVQTTLVSSLSGIHDLGTNAFPQGSSLPVKLKNFNGVLKANIATLNWETEYEENFDYYEVERSVSPSQFKTIARKNANGSTNKTSYYQLADDLSNESSKVFYYRLKMVDKDGRFEYSNVIMLRSDNKQIKNLILTPNPVQGSTANVRIETTAAGNIMLRILDAGGKVIMQQWNKVSVGVNAVQIHNMDQLNPGVYMIQMIAGNGDVSLIKFSKF
jgi:hypothetical protein